MTHTPGDEPASAPQDAATSSSETGTAAERATAPGRVQTFVANHCQPGANGAESPVAPAGVPASAAPWEQPPPDPAITHRSLWILAGALGAGILGDAMLRAWPPGLGMFLWVCAVVGIAVMVSRHARLPLSRQVIVPAAVAVACAAGLAWRDSRYLRWLDLAMIAVCAGACARGARSRDLRTSGIMDVPASVIGSAFHAAFGALPIWSQEIDWARLAHARVWRESRAVMRGLLMALPLLLVFGYLFASADMQFEKLMRGLLRWDMRTVCLHVMTIAVCAWAIAGYLRCMFVPAEAPPARRDPGANAIGPIETAVVLASLNLLFLAFVTTQFPQLFGGLKHLLDTAGLTAAQYARRGFFQLATASALVLPVLLYGHWLLRRDTAAERIFRALSASLIAMLFVIMASALQRMRLYTTSYGLTELRFYVTAFIICLAVLFAWFCLSVLRGRREYFVAGAFLIGFAALEVLHAVNPDDAIARGNLSRASARVAIDPAYLSSLSADAVPALAEALPGMTDDSLVGPVRGIIARHAAPPARWQSWNWARSQAARAARNAGK